MINRKETKQYTLTVEGNTEKWYFEWLQKEINSFDTAKYKVKINLSIQQYPLSYAKKLNAKSTPFVVHICDIEGNIREDIEKFETVLSELKEAKEQKRIEYRLGYSNFTFELWMILHKQNCSGSFTDRSKYLNPINSAYDENFIDLKTYKKEENFKRCLSKLNITDVKKAVERSKRIMDNNKKNGNIVKQYKGFKYLPDNPSLTIWEIVEQILNECKI
ncbi:MAG: RloB domain-containing protein [Oscillospiraceae bacterium]|nr:RloB domain-containing protein [Oscillospiraceae bacterium]